MSVSVEPFSTIRFSRFLVLVLALGLLATPQRALASEEEVAPATPLVAVEKDAQLHIERIEITGNQMTRDSVIRRELGIFEGDPFDAGSLEASRRRVAALGLFARVDASARRGSADNQVVVIVHVVERPTGTVETTLDLSSLESFLLTTQVSQSNLFGRGQTASLAVELGSLRTALQLSFVDPHLFDSDWLGSLHYSHQDLDYGLLWRSNAGDLTFGYHLTPELTLQVGYGIQVEEIERGGSSSETGILLASRGRNGLSSSLLLTLTWDQRDNRLFPTAGNYQSVSLEYSPEWLGASFRYLRFDANTRWYFPLFWRIVFAAQGSLGYINDLDDHLPINKLFFPPSGSHTVHDYPLHHEPTVFVGGSESPDSRVVAIALAGNKQLLFNFELVFPILDWFGLRGVVFYDAGNFWSKAQDFFASQPHAGPLNLVHSVGLGVRWFSPIGPLRIEWGIPLTRLPGEDPFLFELAFGSYF